MNYQFFPYAKIASITYNYLSASNLLFNIFLLLQFAITNFSSYGKIASSITYNYLTPPIFYLTFSYFYNLLLPIFPWKDASSITYKDCKLYLQLVVGHLQIFYLTFSYFYNLLLPIFPPWKDCKLYYLQLFNTSDLLFNIFLLLQFAITNFSCMERLH